MDPAVAMEITPMIGVLLPTEDELGALTMPHHACADLPADADPSASKCADALLRATDVTHL